jgi:hypothetical protein
MKRTFVLILTLCLLLPVLAGCSKELPPFDAVSAAAPSEAFPLTQVAGLTLTPPKSFSAGETGNAWYAPDYPSDGSCITVHTAAANPQFASYTAENVKQALEASYKASLETDVAVTMDRFEFCTVNTFKALQLEYHFTYRDIQMRCLQYLIQADRAYTVTCIQVAGAKWMTEFNAVADSLAFAWEIVSAA